MFEHLYRFVNCGSLSITLKPRQSLKHPVGTCAMAKQDLGGVVDSSLKVYGTANFRVVDASIIPMHVAAHTQSTTYAIGEKVSWSAQGGQGRVLTTGPQAATIIKASSIFA